MAKNILNQIKLGVFVIAGMVFLILLLYIIGKNQNLFGKTFVLKARFENVHGLMRGNNIRFGGIDAGTVGSVEVLDDTTIEVTLLVKRKFKDHIRNNAKVSITTDGLMGNRLINIIPSKEKAPFVEEGDILFSSDKADTDEMLEVLNTTNNDIAIIVKELKQTVRRINSSQALWTVLNDESLPAGLRSSLLRVKQASGNISGITEDLQTIVNGVKSGKGTIGELLMDSTVVLNIKDAIHKIKDMGVTADSLSQGINKLISSINNEINNGQGTVNALLKDEKVKDEFVNSLKNIEQGTKSFNDNMEAIKHSILFRGYFRRLEKQKQEPPSIY